MSWYDWDAERAKQAKKVFDPGQIGWSGPFLYGLSGYRGEYARLHPVGDRRPVSDSVPTWRQAERLVRRRRQDEIADEVADEFNKLLGDP